MAELQEVVLLDELGCGIGTAPKSEVHHATTPLHLAFSAYVFDADGRLLVTQRSLSKATFPGVWTNSVCGHPAPGESIETAVRRRVRQEVGLELGDLRLVLPEFRYTATMNGVRENEMCPVWVAGTEGDVTLDPSEVESVEWQPWPAFSQGVLDGSRSVSTWCGAQVEALDRLGPGPASWPTADPHRLPPAAQAA